MAKTGINQPGGVPFSGGGGGKRRKNAPGATDRSPSELRPGGDRRVAGPRSGKSVKHIGGAKPKSSVRMIPKHGKKG